MTPLRSRLRLPAGTLLRDRVVCGPGVLLADALDRRLTGYAVVRPQSSLLLGDDSAGVLTFEDGIPVVAYHAASDRGGPSALAGLGPGPCRVELRALDAAEPNLAKINATTALQVAPDAPAERLAGDRALAERTRAVAPTERVRDPPAKNAVEAFLEDDERIAAIREQAREEARARATDWGLAEFTE